MEVTGNLIPKPISLSGFYIDTGSIVTNDDKYRLKASYGDDTNFELSGVYVAKFFEKGENK